MSLISFARAVRQRFRTPSVDNDQWKSLAVSLALGVAGGSLFQLTGMPLAWMLGPLVANLLGAMAGLTLAVPERLRSLFLGVLGRENA